MARKIAFIGVGNMASAIINGSIKAGHINFSDLILYDVFPEKCHAYTQQGAILALDEATAASMADCIVLAVKPQNFPELLPKLAQVEDIEKKLVVTIAAGITVDTVSTALHHAPVVRVLPNTPMLIGMGVSVICRSDVVSREDFDFVSAMFESSGSIIYIDESEMNRMISVTSSSPAYVFAFIKAICDGAAAQGLERDDILPAVCDMVVGAATLLKQGGMTPDAQIQMVTSKGGTTERAMNVLTSEDMNAMIQRAMLACTQRADELGKK